MKKGRLTLSIFLFFCFITHYYLYTDNEVNAAEQAFLADCINNRFSDNSYHELYMRQPERAVILKQQAKAVEHIFNEVLKTEKQLVPKQCNYLIAYGYEYSSPENLKKACDNLRLAAFANMDRPSMKIFIAGSKQIRAALKAALKQTPMPQERVFEVDSIKNSTTARAIIPLILEDGMNNHYDMDNMLYRRILLLTVASNTRIGYAAFISALGSNDRKMILDDFSSLDMPRKKLDSPSFEERKRAFNELLVSCD